MTTASKQNNLTRRFTDPLLQATADVFESFLGFQTVLVGMTSPQNAPEYPVNMGISVTGPGEGRAVLSLSGSVALDALTRAMAESCTEIDDFVRDFVGELANMIGGGAKKELEHLGFALGLPELVDPSELLSEFPTGSDPVTLRYECEGGEFAIHAGFVEDVSNTAEEDSLDLVVVDDDQVVQRLMSKLLSKQLNVSVFNSAEDGLIAVGAKAPDVAMCDIHLPGMNGLEMIRRIRSDPQTASLPIVVMSGDESRETLLEAFQAGADDFIRKTDFTRRSVLGKLHRAVKLRRA